MVGVEPLIEIIIPNWNGKEMLEHCLVSLRRQVFSNFRVIVVDNGSKDGSIQLLRDTFPEVKIIELLYNTGFCVAVNKGIEASRAPWLLLLNNDMEVATDCLENLRLAMERYPGCDVFALKMLNYHQRDFIDGAGDAVLRGGVGYRLGTMERDGEKYQGDRESFGACAGAALYHRDVFAKIGLFDTDFFAYLEDVDLNMRARRHGLRCMYIAGSKVFHIGSASSGSKINRLTVRLSTRNNLHVIAKNYPLLVLLRFFPAIVVYQFAWMLFCLKKGMLPSYFAGFFQGILRIPYFVVKGRRQRKSDTVIPSEQFATMIQAAEREAVGSIMDRRIAAGKNNFLLSCYCKLFFW